MSAAHRAVVALTEGPHSGYGCTGVLIADRVVLTAAHCFQPGFIARDRAQVYFGQEVPLSGEVARYVEVTEVSIHPHFAFSDLSDDVALVRLGGETPFPVAPIPPLPGPVGLTDADLGKSMDISGFGLTEAATERAKLHVSVPIKGICPGPWPCAVDGFPVSLVPRSIGFLQDAGGPCAGDSGGPAFLFRGKQEYVVGITSQGDGACSRYGISAQVDRYEGFIRDFLVGFPGKR